MRYPVNCALQAMSAAAASLYPALLGRSAPLAPFMKQAALQAPFAQTGPMQPPALQAPSAQLALPFPYCALLDLTPVCLGAVPVFSVAQGS